MLHVNFLDLDHRVPRETSASVYIPVLHDRCLGVVVQKVGDIEMIVNGESGEEAVIAGRIPRGDHFGSGAGDPRQERSFRTAGQCSHEQNNHDVCWAGRSPANPTSRYCSLIWTPSLACRSYTYVAGGNMRVQSSVFNLLGNHVEDGCLATRSYDDPVRFDFKMPNLNQKT